MENVSIDDMLEMIDNGASVEDLHNYLEERGC